MNPCPTLFSPISIGTMSLRNRLILSPMETGYATRDGLPSDRLVAYYEARAKGGVGLVTLGACTIDARHREVPRSMDFGRDEVIDAHRRLVDRVHAAGACVQPQLVHPGPDGLAPHLSGLPNVGPSAVSSYRTGDVCRALAEEEIPLLVDQYRVAATRILRAGYDGIELHAAHGYMLLGSFLSPRRNHRTDGYTGRTEAGRTRLLHEVIRAIKAETGSDLPITLRLSGYERTPGGRAIQDTARIAPSLVEAGVDAFHVSGGVIDPLTSQMVTGSHFGPAHNLAAAESVARVVDVPVIVVGRIHDPVLAERILAEGSVQLVAMGRPLLADPELPSKASGGRVREIRRCISCQSCIDSMEKGRMACAVNPFTGRETELDPARAPHPRRVAIVGGGPAGLEAARLAALRGHAVIVYEKAPRLGGALLAAALVHSDNEPLLDFLTAEMGRSDVEIRLGVEATPDMLVAAGHEVVVVATGGRLEIPELVGIDQPHVWTGVQLRALLAGEGSLAQASGQVGPLREGVDWMFRRFGRRGARWASPGRMRRLFRHWMPIGRRVVVVGADLAALELAEFLAERGRRVTILAADAELAEEVGPKRRTEHMDRLDRLGVVVLAGWDAERIEREAVVHGGGRRIEADAVIVAGRLVADTSLVDALEGRVSEVHAVGDCTGLGLIAGAIESGARVGCAI